MPPNKTKVEESLVDQLCNITDVTKVVATNLLEACNNDLEMAINMHMETVPENSTNGSSSMIDEVRAPIPQRQEILVEGPDQIAYSFHNKTRQNRSVFDRFRDFQAETKRQEEELLEEESKPSSSKTTKNKMKTLEDLFRPPLDLMFRGTFQAARDKGVSSKKWLLVNVQNSSEFSCQVLNRDVWSNQAVKSIIQEHFVFWQIYHDSEEGLRYMNFYPVREWPYVSLVDPRTGECMASWRKVDALSFCEIVTEFLSSRNSLNDSLNADSPKKKKVKLDCVNFRQSTSNSILEADETAQMEAAIKASLEADDDSPDEIETFEPDPPLEQPPRPSSSTPPTVPPSDATGGPSSSGEEQEPEKWKKHLGKDSDPVSKLILRLPDGTRDSVQMPSSSELMALVLYVATKGFSNESYELVTNFPRRRLSYLDFNSSLKSVGLFPQETVFVQKR